MDKDRLNEINEILDLGKKILDIEEIITSTKYMKQHQSVISVMKNIKNELVDEIARRYKEPTYSVDNSTIEIEKNSYPILGVTPELGVKYTTEEPVKKSPMSPMSPEEKERHQSYIEERIKESLNNTEEIVIEEDKKDNEPQLIITPKRNKPNAYTKNKSKK